MGNPKHLCKIPGGITPGFMKYVVSQKELLGLCKIVALQKKYFLIYFCLVSRQNIQKFLNQKGFSRQVKLIVLFPA